MSDLNKPKKDTLSYRNIKNPSPVITKVRLYGSNNELFDEIKIAVGSNGSLNIINCGVKNKSKLPHISRKSAIEFLDKLSLDCIERKIDLFLPKTQAKPDEKTKQNKTITLESPKKDGSKTNIWINIATFSQNNIENTIQVRQTEHRKSNLVIQGKSSAIQADKNLRYTASNKIILNSENSDELRKVPEEFKKALLTELFKNYYGILIINTIHNQVDVYVDNYGNLIIKPLSNDYLLSNRTPKNIETTKLRILTPLSNSKSATNIQNETYNMIIKLHKQKDKRKEKKPYVQNKPNSIFKERKTSLGTKCNFKSSPHCIDYLNLIDYEEVASSNYPPTTIKINHKIDNHLKEHPINKIILSINRFLELTFRHKDSEYDIIKIHKLGKALGLNIMKNSINLQTFKNREQINIIKEKLLKQLWNTLNTENHINITLPNNISKATLYKFCVCNGNNPMLVKTILKQRWWWNYGDKNDESLNLLWTQWSKKKFLQELPCANSSNKLSETNTTLGIKMCNHIEYHYQLSNKKAMFINLYRYYTSNNIDPFIVLPLTFHIKNGINDPEFLKFSEYFNKLSDNTQGIQPNANIKKIRLEKNVWIIKPGEYSNRGNGIQVLENYEDIKRFIIQREKSKASRTFIIQKYIEKPLLINKRKFDIRMYGMITSINGYVKGYYYEEGYIRTSSKEFSLKNLTNKAVHLTNDAVQKKEEDYGKYEPGNKLSFGDLQKYLDSVYQSYSIDFARDILPQIKKIIADTFHAVYPIIDPNRRLHTFEV